MVSIVIFIFCIIYTSCSKQKFFVLLNAISHPYLTPWNRVIFGKLIFTQFNKFPAF